MSRWLKRRPRNEIFLVAQAVAALTATRLALHWVRLPVLRRGVWRILAGGRQLPEGQRLPMARVLGCTEAASRVLPVSTTCRATAIVVQALLQRHGYAVQLRIGVRLPAAGEFAAHAWLEHEGRIVVGGPASVVDQYQALPDLEHLIA